MPPNTPLGDKFREAAGMIADCTSEGVCEALTRVECSTLAFEHMYRPDSPQPDRPYWMAGNEKYHYAQSVDDHRIIALLLAAAMADTGDLK